jgi:hypothetical protein
VSRHDSLLRRALAAAADGKHKEIAVDVFPLNDCYTGTKKLGRMLDGGDNGDLSPSYDAMDRTVIGDPETFLSVLSEELGFEPPRRSVVDIGAAVDAVSAKVELLLREVAVLGKQQRKLAMVRRTIDDVQRKVKA